MKKTILFLLLLLTPASLGFRQEVRPVTVTEMVKTSTSWDGNPLPAYAKGKPEITIVKITVQPGVELPLHKHPMINAGAVLSGEITVRTEDKKTIRLKAGDAIAEVVETWHSGKNEGKVPAEIIVFYAGTVGTPITIEK